MTSQLGGRRQDKIKHIIKGIKLEPATSKYGIDLKILVGDKELRRLPEIRSGQELRWNDVIECLVSPWSRIGIRIYEIHTFTRLRIATVEYVISEVLDSPEMLLESDSGKCTATIAFAHAQLTMNSLATSLAQVQKSERHKRIIKDLGSTRSAVRTILTVGGFIAEFIPVTEAAFALCEKAWQKVEEQEECDANIERLIHGLVNITPFVEVVTKAVQIPQLKATTEALISFINDACRFIVEYKSDGNAVTGLFHRSSAREQVDNFLETLNQLKEQFDRGINIQAMLEAQRATLKELKPLGQAVYDANRACMKGTRTSIIEEILNWIRTTEVPNRLLWLYGQAGLGKSAIATSLCQEFADARILAASFFCKRDDPERRNPQRVLTSIIHGLASHHDAYGKVVVATLQEDSSVCTAPMQTQFDKLVKEPMRHLEFEDSLSVWVVVVDALDECGIEDTRRQLIEHLCYMTQLMPWLRIIVTSRPDTEIKDSFSQSDITSFWSRDLYDYDASNDIGTFVSKRLSSSPRARSLPNGTADLLTIRAAGLFIWAQTACEFVLNSLDPNARLVMLLQDAPLKASRSALDNLYMIAIEASIGDHGKDNIGIIRQCLGAIIVCSTRMPLSIGALKKLLGRRIELYVLQSVVDSLGSVLYIDSGQAGAVRVYHPSFADFITTPARSAHFCVDTRHWNAEFVWSCIETMSAELKFNICSLETSYKRNRDVQGLAERVHEAIGQHLRYACLYWVSHITAESENMEVVKPRLNEFFSSPKALFWFEVLSLIGEHSPMFQLVEALFTRSDQSFALIKGMHFYKYLSDLERFLQTFYDPISQSTPHLYVSALAFLPVQTTLEQLRQEHFANTIRIRVGAEQTWSAWLLCVSDEARGIRAVAVSPDGHRIVSVLTDDTLRMWDSETGAPVGEPLLEHTHSGNSVVFSPGGRSVVTGLRKRGVRVWAGDAGSTGEEVSLLGHALPIACITYSSDGSLVATGSFDKSLRLWNVDSLSAVGQPFVGHSGDVRCIAFSHDNRRIVSGSSDKTLRLWDTKTNATIGESFVGHTDVITCVAFSADNCRIASGSADKTICVWSADTGSLVVQPLVHHAGWIQSVAFHPSKARLVSGSIDNSICIWDLDTGLMIGSPLVGHSASVNSVVFSPDGRHIVSGSSDGTVRVWDANIAPVMGRSLIGHSDRVIYVKFSPDSRFVISGSGDMMVRAWDTETGIPVGTVLVNDSSEAQSIASSPDGRYIISGSPDNAVRIWDSRTGLLIHPPLVEHLDCVTCVSFSPDSCWIVSGSQDKTLRLWNVTAGTSVGNPYLGHTDTVLCASFSPDNRLMISGSCDKTLRLWNVTSGVMVNDPMTGHRFWVTSVAFLPNSNHVVSGSADQTVRIWDICSGTQVHVLEGHAGPVKCIAVSCDGELIASGSTDSALRVWDASTGAPIGDPLVGHSAFITCIALSPDGRLIASGGWDKTVRIWDLESVRLSKAWVDVPSETSIPASVVTTGKTIIPLDSNHDQHGRAEDLAFRLPPQINKLMRYCTPDGWVSIGSQLLFWIPPAYRRLTKDDSLVVITAEPLLCMILLDFSRFMHGDSWPKTYVTHVD